jgi:adenylosuccinate lyase
MTEEQLKEITAHAENLLDVADIAEILEVDPAELQREYNKKTEVYKAYRKGFLLTKSKLNKSAVQQAVAGSSPALNQVLKILETLNNENIKKRL